MPKKKGDLLGGRYEIFEEPMTGGMGIVYFCIDREENIPVAIKTFREDILSGDEDRERFRREALTWISLGSHRNIVKAIYVQAFEGMPHIVMEAIAGRLDPKAYADYFKASLRNWIGNEALTIDLVLYFAIQVCNGMIFACDAMKKKGKNFVHRDIKPDNILITFNKVAKITDFGLAKSFQYESMETPPPGESEIDKKRDKGIILSLKGAALGTPPYMSPEQCRADARIDIRSDIYSFGCVLFEMACKRRPFVSGKSVLTSDLYYDLMFKHLENKPPAPASLNPESPTALNDVILKCLEKVPENRYKKFTQLKSDLLGIYSDWTGKRFRSPKYYTGERESLDDRKSVHFGNLGFSMVNISEYEEALKWLFTALETEPDDAYILNNIGRAMCNMGDSEKAIEYYNKALDVKPLYENALYNKALSLEKLGKQEEALDYYSKAIKASPGFWLALRAKADTLLNLGKYEEAINACDKSLEIMQDNHATLSLKARICRRNGDLNGAIECYDIMSHSDPTMLILKVEALSELGKHQEAQECLNDLHEKEQKSTTLLNYVATKLRVQGKYMESIDCCMKSIRINPESSRPYVIKANALTGLGKNDESLDCYKKAISIEENDGEAWFNQGAVLSSLKRFNEAIESYERAIKINPYDSQAYFYMSTSLFTIGKRQEGMTSLEKSIELKPGEPYVHFMKGIMHLDLGEKDKMIVALEKYLSLEPDDENNVKKAKELIRQKRKDG